MITIHLNNFILHGKHGVHIHEHLFDAPFLISIHCALRDDTVVNNIADTVDYAKVYAMVKNEFNKPQQLLETLCNNIITAIKNEFQIIEKITITIEKLNAPIENFNGKVGVTISA